MAFPLILNVLPAPCSWKCNKSCGQLNVCQMIKHLIIAKDLRNYRRTTIANVKFRIWKNNCYERDTRLWWSNCFGEQMVISDSFQRWYVTHQFTVKPLRAYLMLHACYFAWHPCSCQHLKKDASCMHGLTANSRILYSTKSV